MTSDTGLTHPGLPAGGAPAGTRALLDGATAIVRGALAAGCDFFAGYPITPATPILLQMMREMPRMGGVAIQGEDELASIGMCIGAAAAGRRALTATSGPGLSLYSENIGLAIMAELPLVIVDVQRLGPATGGATTVGQGDVQFARWGTGGGYPLIVLAPSTIIECATLTAEAFALAARFRTPVVVLTDKALNLTRATVDAAPLIALERQRLPGAAASPWALGKGRVMRFTGSPHDARQMITKEPVVVERLNRRLIAKVADHRDELARVDLDLDPRAGRDKDGHTLLIAYGITAGAVRAAVKIGRARGRYVSSAIVQSLWPVPEAHLREAAARAGRTVVCELNPGLYMREVRRLCSDSDVVSLHRIDGQLISPAQMLDACL
jgi:2-oxoglutarate/2-oxoacid ferredoxin oxidoreductase subunit alpha